MPSKTLKGHLKTLYFTLYILRKSIQSQQNRNIQILKYSQKINNTDQLLLK